MKTKNIKNKIVSLIQTGQLPFYAKYMVFDENYNPFKFPFDYCLRSFHHRYKEITPIDIQINRFIIEKWDKTILYQPIAE